MERNVIRREGSPSSSSLSTPSPSSSSSTPPGSPQLSPAAPRLIRSYSMIQRHESDVERDAEYELLSNPSLLANTGVLLFNIPYGGKERAQLVRTSSASNLMYASMRRLPNRGIVWTGKVVFSLNELPIHSQWLTPTGQSVDRISSRDVLLCDTVGKPKTIAVPQQQIFTILYLPDYLIDEIFLHLLPLEHRFGSLLHEDLPKPGFVPPRLEAANLEDMCNCRLACRAFNVSWKKLINFDRETGPTRTIPIDDEAEIGDSGEEQIVDKGKERLDSPKKKEAEAVTPEMLIKDEGKRSPREDKEKEMKKKKKKKNKHKHKKEKKKNKKKNKKKSGSSELTRTLSCAESGDNERTEEDDSGISFSDKAKEDTGDNQTDAPPAPPLPDASANETSKSSDPYLPFFGSFSKLPTANHLRKANSKDVIQPLSESGEQTRREIKALLLRSVGEDAKEVDTSEGMAV